MDGEAIYLLGAIKFEPVGCDPLDAERDLNLIEQVNQTFTNLASFKAAKELFTIHHDLKSLTLNLGTQSGSDIENTNNNKLNNDKGEGEKSGG